MSTTYEWSITNLDRRTSDNMVWRVEYKIRATKGEHRASVRGRVKIPPSASPTPFQSLTKDQVIDWVTQKIGTVKEQAHYADLDVEIDKKENVKVIHELPAAWKDT